MSERNQSNLYFRLRDHLRTLDPNLSEKYLSRLVRNAIDNGLVREERETITRIFDHDGNEIGGAR